MTVPWKEIALGKRYQWPDGTVIRLDSLTRTAAFNARFDNPDDDYGVSLVTIPASDLKALVDAGLVEQVDYHHVGTGNTVSRHWCDVCEGWYGVPHDQGTHEHTAKKQFRADCACAPCQRHYGKYPSGGIFMNHEKYLEKHA